MYILIFEIDLYGDMGGVRFLLLWYISARVKANMTFDMNCVEE